MKKRSSSLRYIEIHINGYSSFCKAVLATQTKAGKLLDLRFITVILLQNDRHPYTPLSFYLFIIASKIQIVKFNLRGSIPIRTHDDWGIRHQICFLYTPENL